MTGASGHVGAHLVDALDPSSLSRALKGAGPAYYLIHSLVAALDTPATRGRVLDIGGPDVLTYREMLERTARITRQRFATRPSI
jgi:uncharacterized protein YbjT (DUF2867 family)